jgi:hypothetical protein
VPEKPEPPDLEEFLVSLDGYLRELGLILAELRLKSWGAGTTQGARNRMALAAGQ